MSWSFDYQGTPKAVKAAVIKFCDKAAESYKGTQEEQDLLMVRDRVVATVDALKLGSDGYSNFNAVRAKGSGSHSSSGAGPASVVSARFDCEVTRQALLLDEAAPSA